MEKKEARRKIRQAIAAIPPAIRREKEEAIRARLYGLSEFMRARRVMLYVTMPEEEIDTLPIIARLLAEGKAVYAPKLVPASREMRWFAIPSLDALRPGLYGILEPPEGPSLGVAEIDFVLVPGLGFDENLNRLGRGAGYYDRFLSDPALTATKCSIAYDCQVLPELPHDPHDVPVDILITETRLLRRRSEGTPL